jgi:hypothetical protein
LVDWVDGVLANGPLAVGSAPIYGEHGNSTAFAALDAAIGQSINVVTRYMPLFGTGVSIGMSAANGDVAGMIVGAAGIVAGQLREQLVNTRFGWSGPSQDVKINLIKALTKQQRQG